MAGKPTVHIGTSGWHYEHWKGPFYPEDISPEKMLGFYAERFHTVEVNNTFYQMPEKKTLAEWRETVPKGFIFAVKASRFITHMKKLKDPEEPLSRFFAAVDELGPKRGPVLFQLPPRWGYNAGRLRAFLDALPRGNRYAFEFRDQSWYRREVYEVLRQYGAAFCIYHLAGHLSPKEVTADFVYIRLHGPAGAYEGQYSAGELSGWAGAVSAWLRQGKSVYCYFDNDQNGYAAQDALKLQQMVGSFSEGKKRPTRERRA
jgi:uncharacterized protein YecE (DUF72 family)